MTIIPQQNDVLFGKGTVINRHHGNRNFRSMVELQKEEFQQAQKRTLKREIANTIIRDLEALGGRFLMEDSNPPNAKNGNVSNVSVSENKGGQKKNPDPDILDGVVVVTNPIILASVWVPVDPDKVFTKVMHRLREKRKGNGNVRDKKRPREQDQEREQEHVSHFGYDLKPPPEITNSTKASAKVMKSLDAIAVANAKVANEVSTLCENSKKGQDNSEPKSRPDTAVAKVGTVDTKNRMGNISALTADTKVDTDVMGPHIRMQYKPDRAATQTSSATHSVRNAISLSAPASIQSRFQMLAGRITTGNSGSATARVVKMSIPQWIRLKSSVTSTQKDDYLKSAVDISWRLTKHLIQLVKDAQIALSDMTAKNVIISVEETPSTSKSTTAMLSPPNIIVIRDVQFAPSHHGENSNYFHDNKRSPPCAATTALGGILLDIFSMGKSSETGNLVQAKANDILIEMGMPLSICRLVCDLLGTKHEPGPNMALTSLEDALWDLSQMKNSPQQFLFDRICHLKAMSDTCLFANTDSPHLFGRKKELGILMSAKNRIADHLKWSGTDNTYQSISEGAAFGDGKNLMCETVFLSGYAGSGKSSLLSSLIRTCTEEGWFVGSGKFDKHTTPHMVIAKMTDDFFRRYYKKPSMFGTLAKIIQHIISVVGRDGFDYVSELIPALSLSPLLPQIVTTGRRNDAPSSIDDVGAIGSAEKRRKYFLQVIGNAYPLLPQILTTGRRNNAPSSIDDVGAIGSAPERRKYFLQVIGNAICSMGIPLLICLDDLQWSEKFAMEMTADFIDSQSIGQPKSGVLVVGAFRTNEVADVDDLLGRINQMHLSKKINSIMLTVNNLTTEDIARLLGAKLCLPLRYCQELARVIHFKTIGNPFFVLQFMKTIVENGMLEFSIDARSWIWDCEVIDFQMISKGVAELLTIRLNRLPSLLVETLKLASCFGFEVDSSTVDLLNLGLQIPFNMQDALHLAINEGLMDKAGPVYAFTHDLIKEAVYELIPANDRKSLHKNIGTTLLRAASNNPPIYLLAVEQINISCIGNMDISPEESAHIAQINTTAAKFAIAASSFEQARSHIDAGMHSLGNNHWQNLYPLSLELFELSATLSCTYGDMERLSECLAEVMSNVQSFEDSLTSSSLLARFLADSSEYEAAVDNCINILSKLGEEISTDVSPLTVMNELAVLQPTLANVTVDQLKLLPPMTNTAKLNAMKFLSLLASICSASKPMFVPILGCRLVRLTIEHGFCDDSIVGFVTAGCGLSSFCDDLELGYRIGKVCDELIDESPNKHALRSRLCHELDCVLFGMVDPRHQITSCIQDRYKSAMITGDMESATRCLLNYFTFSFSTAPSLLTAEKAFIVCLEQSEKYQKHTICLLAMSTFRACIHLTGRANDVARVKSYEELEEIGKSSNNMILLVRISMSCIIDHFYDRNYIKVIEQSEKWPTAGQRHNRVHAPTLYMGVAFFNLARQTRGLDLREKGKKCLEKMMKLKTISKWNYESSANLLEAEFLYLDGQLELAEEKYKASIKSAQDHKCIQEEAMAFELFGIFCIENQMSNEGTENLHKALEKYRQWGAMKKAERLQDFIDVVDPTSSRSLEITV